MEYSFPLKRSTNGFEDYQKGNRYIARFKVYDENGNDISKQIVYIVMYISTSGMIGLGTELIRLAHNFEEGKEVRIVPSSKENGAQQSMGIYLTPESCELVIKCENFKPIDYYIEEYRNKIEADK